MARFITCGAFASAALGLALFAGCESTKKSAESAPASMGAINDKCPVMNEAIDPKTTVSYHGHTVGFCCAGCIPKWNAMSDGDKNAFVAKNTK